ncbi:MAG TPA: hypothetical protein VHJ54_11035 [Solirubrobacterales bacterium]|jgi:hypothetical protein|nr:hypothetical protein [Solirubrobacterales bacterium]
MSRTASENPACTSGDDLPPPPFAERWDPAEPHPDEPGAPADAPPRRAVNMDTQEFQALVADASAIDRRE